MATLPGVKMSECEDVQHCYHCAHAINTDRFYDEEYGWDWDGMCPSCARDALGRDMPAQASESVSSNAMYAYHCPECGSRGQAELPADKPDLFTTCRTCGARVMAEWDGGVQFDTARRS